MMLHYRLVRVCAVSTLVAFLGTACNPTGSEPTPTPAPTASPGPTPTPAPGDDTVAAKCGACHADTSAKFVAGSHSAMTDQCLTCHPNGEEHRQDFTNVQAEISFSTEHCAGCHADQATSFAHEDAAKVGHFGGSVKSSKYDEFPHYQYIMGGHGFTKEYTEDREHRFLLKDHIDTQRKQATTCMQCKSTPVTYYWNETRRRRVQYEKSMPWADVIAEIETKWPETMEYGAGCTHCHDPHSGDFRLIRKGVLEAILERGTDPYTPSLNVVSASMEEL